MPKILPLSFQITLIIWMALNTVIALAQQRQPPFFDETHPELPIIIDYPGSLVKKDHRGEGPMWQNPATDVNFITDTGPTLDTECRYRSEGPIEIVIPVTRVVGEVNNNGNLIRAQKLIKLGLLSPTANLAIPIYDVDLPEEVDEVWFNGVNLGHLMGGDGIWELNRFEIPIELVKFPQRNLDGTPPQPAINTVIIQIDTISPQPLLCTSVDWAALSFKTMSPIILIQDSQLDEDFFSRYNFTTILQQKYLLFDNSINLAVDTIKDNGMALNSAIPQLRASFGVDSIHLIVHSQSGLDVREYLANYQHQHDENLTILSYTSLGTPHNGSMLADVVTHRAIAIENERMLYSPDFMATAIQVSGLNKSIADLTTFSTAWFNLMNIPRLPANSIINTIAADADSNANGQMDREPDEYLELRAENQPLKNIDNQMTMGVNIGHQQSRFVVDVPYQLLSHTNQAKISYKYQQVTTVQTQHWLAKVADISTAAPWKNDVLVTVASAQGQDALSNHTTNTRSLEGSSGKNHVSIADTDVANTVITWLIAIETSHGDLQ
jgi:hypothetical protein